MPEYFAGHRTIDRVGSRTKVAAPIEPPQRAWCLAALNSLPLGELALDRLRDICRGTAAASGEADVEAIDMGSVALALLGDPKWEIVCRARAPAAGECE